MAGSVTVIKKSPIVIVKNFLILQIVMMSAYTLAGSLAYYAKIYRSLAISRFISFQIAQALFIIGLETIIVFYIFFSWYKEYLQLQSQQLVYGRGIFYRQRMIIPFSHISNITYHQSPLGKLIKYGTLELTDNLSVQIISFHNIPEPQHWAEEIIKLKQQAAYLPTTNHPDENFSSLLQTNEHEGLEFKSSLRWDHRVNKVNRQLEKAAMKTVAGFLNSQGGQLVLGVGDDKKILGLDADLRTLGKPNPDGFENHFSHLFHNMIGVEFRSLIQLQWHRLEDKNCCVVKVAPAAKPAYLKSDDQEEFYIRTGNGTTALKFSEAAAYIQSRFT